MSNARAADRVGQVLGGRYRLLAPIGTGASATVYLADDVVLRRRVAVKVLHDALAGDAAFLRRFEAEARAAAALNHPHIMAVHDWGQGDVPYLVTELLDGGSLRGLLDRGSRLDPAQARQVGVDAARALDHAHRRGFVHRDIKPANLLFDDEGMVRIADFGLARALAEAAWTEPAGAVLGTAKYASPEQAQGATLDGSSDVYSLGLVLMEALTGSVPFTADTTLGTLMARIGRPVPVPEELGALVPALRAAGAADPADRPDAAAFATMLMAAGDLGPVARLPLAGIAALRPDDLDPREPTTIHVSVAPVGGPVFVDPTVSSAPAGSAPIVVQPATRTVGRAIDGTSAATTVDGEATSVRRPRRRRRLLLVALAALVVIGGVGAFALLRTPTHTIGSYVDLPIDEARAALASKGLRVATESQISETVPVDVVIDQDPPPGTTMSEGSTVTLVVSSGPPPVAVPTDLVGMTVEQATASLARASLRPGELTDTFDENVAKGIVVALGPGVGATAPKGSAVPLVVSAGARPRIIPEGLVGRPITDVTAQLESLGLKVKRIDDWSETVPESVVMVVTPAAGQSVAKGSTVDVTVSKGKRPVTIPATVVGQPCSAGASALQGLGLVVNINPFGATVRSVNPVAGSQVRAGSTVTIACG